MDSTAENEENNEVYEPRNLQRKLRNLIGFWLLGLCNNYPYVIMLSAAHDVLKASYDHPNNTVHDEQANKTLCNDVSTGAILLADILPSLFIKSFAPFVGISTSIRMLVVTVLCGASLATVAFSSATWMTFLGVVFASVSSGLGETTLLGYSAFFPRDVVSSWSSGTGGSGLIGALSYALLTHVTTPRKTLLILLFIPVLFFISYYFLLVHPPVQVQLAGFKGIPSEDISPSRRPLLTNVEISESVENVESTWAALKLKLSMAKSLWPYAIPLMAVYFAEYFINQGLAELIVFPEIWLSYDEQYRWYQVDYQLGVFLSRSSVNLIQIQHLWILPILQFGNLAFFFVQTAHPFVGSIWIILAMILFEGLLGGAAYVNTYYKMTKKISSEKLKFSMAVVPLADTLGIALAGAVALPVHAYFCKR